MIHWRIVWTHERAEAKQRQPGGVRGGGIYPVCVERDQSGINSLSCLAVRWLGNSLLLVVLLIRDFDLHVSDSEDLQDQWKCRKCCCKCEFVQLIRRKAKQSETQSWRIKPALLDTLQMAAASVQPLPNWATMSETVILPLKSFEPIFMQMADSLSQSV